MRKVLRIGEKEKIKLDRKEREAPSDLQTKVAIIQDLIPLGLAAVADVLAQEVEELAGSRYCQERGSSELHIGDCPIPDYSIA